MIKNFSRQTGSSHIVVIVILVIALLGALGFVFWQNFMDKPEPTPQNKTSKTVTYKKYQTDTHPISFSYPDTWSLENAKADDQYVFLRSVDVKTDKGNKASFSVGGQGIGGLCLDTPRLRTTLDVVPTDLKTPRPTTLSFTVMPNQDGSYEARYGLTDTYTKKDEVQVCDNVFYYLFNSGNETYILMSFSGTKRFANMDEAKEFINSDEYKAIKKMILSLTY